MRFFVGILFFVLIGLPQIVLPFTSEEINTLQRGIEEKPLGNRIAFWAEQFIGVPYDRDPLGDYVRQARIVADERVDCMYLTFRAVELALSKSPEDAINRALTMRFRTRGILKDGKVVNYNERYQDGIEMIISGKYGTDITAMVGETRGTASLNGSEQMQFLAAPEVKKGLNKLSTGDIIFFVRDPSKTTGGVIAHMGILKVEIRNEDSSRTVYLIHASGTKSRGGLVKKVLLDEYLTHMQHAGTMISRFSD